jgi:hypothetical protein
MKRNLGDIKYVYTCESGVLCDPRYCSYMSGSHSPGQPCEGSYCESAYEFYLLEKEKEDVRK